MISRADEAITSTSQIFAYFNSIRIQLHAAIRLFVYITTWAYWTLLKKSSTLLYSCSMSAQCANSPVPAHLVGVKFLWDVFTYKNFFLRKSNIAVMNISILYFGNLML